MLALRKKGGVVNTVVAIATAKANIEKSDDEHLKLIDLVRFFLGKKSFSPYGFCKESCNYLETGDTDGARKEAALLFYHEIVSKAERYKIPYSLILNIDQTPTKICSCFNSHLAERNSKHVSIPGLSDKQAITATFTNTPFLQCS